MKKFFSPNIGPAGRAIRGLIAVVLFVASYFAYQVSFWLCILLLVNGGFAVFEALRGWCALRACGVKTRY